MSNPVNIGLLHSYYFDCNVWDLIASHPDSDSVRRFISKPGKRTFVLSMLTAAEVLRISDDGKRRQICSTIASILDPAQALIGDPFYVLRQAALAMRQGDQFVQLPQEEQGLRLRERILDPSSVSQDDLKRLADWIASQKTAFEKFWKDVSGKVTRDRTLTVNGSFLGDQGLVDMMVAAFQADPTLTHGDVRRLFMENGAWGAFGVQVGLSIEMANQHDFSKGKARDLPGGPDFYQFPYLGLVKQFVSDDIEFLRVVRRGAKLLEDWTGHAIKVTSAREFFLQIGFPHPLKP